jgi:ketosteroid isomerase-like protein
MSDDKVEVVRTPMTPTAHGRRRPEERLALRFPRLYNSVSRAIWGLPKSRLRRALIRRLVRTSWEAFNRGDLEAAFLPYHPDCQSIFPPGMTTIGLEAGTFDRDERVRFQQRVIDEWDEMRFEPSELIEMGDRLLSIGHMRLRGLSSGVPVDTEWVAMITTVDGRVMQERIFTDHAAALEAAGLTAGRPIS